MGNLFIKIVAANMSAVADHIREVMAERAHVQGGLSTRSTHEAYIIGYRRACDDIAELVENVELEGK